MAQGSTPSFGWLVIVRTWKGTLETFETTWRAIVLAIAVATAAFAVQYFRNGWAAMMADLWQTVWQTALPVAIVGGAILLWNLWLAPSALAFEAARDALAKSNALRPAIPISVPPVIPPEKPINWAVWKHRSVYTFKELANILAKSVPTNTLGTEGTAYYKLIIDDASHNRLKCHHTFSGAYKQTPDIYPDSFSIHKADAVLWAELKGFDVAHIK